MKVRELVDLLLLLPPDNKVWAFDADAEDFEEVTGIEQDKHDGIYICTDTMTVAEPVEPPGMHPDPNAPPEGRKEADPALTSQKLR